MEAGSFGFCAAGLHRFHGLGGRRRIRSGQTVDRRAEPIAGLQGELAGQDGIATRTGWRRSG